MADRSQRPARLGQRCGFTSRAPAACPGQSAGQPHPAVVADIGDLMVAAVEHLASCPIAGVRRILRDKSTHAPARLMQRGDWCQSVGNSQQRQAGILAEVRIAACEECDQQRMHESHDTMATSSASRSAPRARNAPRRDADINPAPTAEPRDS